MGRKAGVKVLPLPPRKQIPPAPTGLSKKWLAEWNAHHGEDPSAWDHHESIKLGHALIWWTREDDCVEQAERTKDPKERRALLAEARDCAQTALRYHRTLTWPDGEKKKKAGRPPGPEWSTIRGGGA
jgi:hypothetical protein